MVAGLFTGCRGEAANATETVDRSQLASLARLARRLARACKPIAFRTALANHVRLSHSVLDGFEGLREIGDEILDVLDAHRDPDERIGEAYLLPQFPRDAGVRHGGRM